jgi:TP901 family phage tail tape measure protein
MVKAPKFQITAEDKASATINKVTKNMDGMAASAKRIGVGMGAMGAGILAGLGVAAKQAMDFGKGMREVNTMMQLSEESFKSFSGEVLSLSKNLGVDAVESTKALYQAISAGVPKDNAIEFLEVASKAAIGGVTDTATAVDGLTTVINAFKMDTRDAKKVADIMFATVKGGKTTFEELASSMFNVAPIAQASGVSFEEVSAALASLTKQGVPTSVATTQLRAAIQSLTAPTVRQEKYLRELGVEMGKEQIEAKGLAGVMNELMVATGGNMQTLRRLIGSVEGVQAVLALAGENAEVYAADLEAISRATDGAGASTDAFNQMQQSAARQFEIMREKFQGLLIQIGQYILPVLTELIGTVSNIVQKFTDWADKNPELAKTLTKVALAVGAIATALGGLLIALPTIMKVTTALRGLGAAAVTSSAQIGGLGASLGRLAVAGGLTAGAAALGYSVHAYIQEKDRIDKINKVRMDAYNIYKEQVEKINAMMQRSGFIADEAFDIQLRATREAAQGFLDVASASYEHRGALEELIAWTEQYSTYIQQQATVQEKSNTAIVKAIDLEYEYAKAMGKAALAAKRKAEAQTVAGYTPEQRAAYGNVYEKQKSWALDNWQRVLGEMQRLKATGGSGEMYNQMMGQLRQQESLWRTRYQNPVIATGRNEYTPMEQYQTGGTVQGVRGQAVPILAHAGERVSRGGAGNVIVNVTVQGSVQAEYDLAQSIRQELVKIKDRNYDSGL